MVTSLLVSSLNCSRLDRDLDHRIRSSVFSLYSSLVVRFGGAFQLFVKEEIINTCNGVVPFLVNMDSNLGLVVFD